MEIKRPSFSGLFDSAYFCGPCMFKTYGIPVCQCAKSTNQVFSFFTKNSLELSVFDLLKVDVYGKSGVQSVQSLTLTHLFIKYV